MSYACSKQCNVENGCNMISMWNQFQLHTNSYQISLSQILNAGCLQQQHLQCSRHLPINFKICNFPQKLKFCQISGRDNSSSIFSRPASKPGEWVLGKLKNPMSQKLVPARHLGGKTPQSTWSSNLWPSELIGRFAQSTVPWKPGAILLLCTYLSPETLNQSPGSFSSLENLEPFCLSALIFLLKLWI